MEPILTQTAGTPPDSFARPGRSAASWGSIIAGAFVAAGVSLILLSLGSGLGFASISPWPGHGVTAATFTATMAIWLIVTQWLSAAIGGYLAGRLRSRWIGTQAHEVYFRDTAHGLITWAVATVAVAALAGSALTSVISGAAHGAMGAAGAGAAGAGHEMASEPSAAYGTDRLFRANGGASESNRDAGEGQPRGGFDRMDARGEAARILANGIATGSLPDADRTYLASLVSAKAGIPVAEAQQRVDDWINTGLSAADAARKRAAEAAIYTALSLLIGAFIASVSGVLGGRLRDEHP